MLITAIAAQTPAIAQPIDVTTATGTYIGGGITLTASDLRRFADEHAAHCARVAAESGTAAPRGGGIGNVLIVECHGAFGYGTIQGAIDAATDGDVVVVLPNDCTDSGAWIENIDFLGKAIRVQSANPADWNVVEATQLRAPTSVWTIVWFANDESRMSVLSGLHLREEGSTLGAHVHCVGASPTIANCLLTNSPDFYGFRRGVQLLESSPRISGCRFEGTIYAPDGGRTSEFPGYAIYGRAESIELERCSFVNFVFAVTLFSNDLSMTGCEFTDCFYGARLHSVLSNDSAVRVRESRFKNNSSLALQIGVTGVNAFAAIEFCEFINAYPVSHDQLFVGAGGDSIAGITIGDCNFVNGAGDSAGPMINQYGNTTQATPVLVERCRFSGHRGIAYDDSVINGLGADLVVESCLFMGNHARRGAAVNLRPRNAEPGSLEIRNSAFVANSATETDSAIYSEYPTSITNCKFLENYFAGNAPTWSTTTISADATIANSLIWNNGYALETNPDQPWTEVLNVPAERISYSLVQGWSGDGPSTNFAADPHFPPPVAGTWTADAVYDANLGQTRLTDAAANWADDEHADKLLRPDAAGFPQSLIASNTGDTMNVWGDFTALGAAGIAYEIRDFHLTADSPCIDAGDPAFVAAEGATDLDGEPRVMGCRVDIGADEYAQDEITVGDFDGDGVVAVADIPEFVQATLGSNESEACVGDVNGDGRTDGRDIAGFVALVTAG